MKYEQNFSAVVPSIIKIGWDWREEACVKNNCEFRVGEIGGSYLATIHIYRNNKLVANFLSDVLATV